MAGRCAAGHEGAKTGREFGPDQRTRFMMKFSKGKTYDPYSHNPAVKNFKAETKFAKPGIHQVTPYKKMKSRDFKISEIPELIKTFSNEEKRQFFQGDKRKSIASFR